MEGGGRLGDVEATKLELEDSSFWMQKTETKQNNKLEQTICELNSVFTTSLSCLLHLAFPQVVCSSVGMTYTAAWTHSSELGLGGRPGGAGE